MKLFEKMKGGLRKDGFVTIVALGDSVTQGCFETVPPSTDAEAVYHNRLRQKLAALYGCPVNMINAGIGGDSAPGAVERLERDVLSHHPDLVTVCFGLNDVNGAKEAYWGALDTIFSQLNEAGIDAIFLTPNMLNTRVDDSVPEGWLRDYAFKTTEMQNGGRMDEYIYGAIEVAKKHGVPVCDCYSKWKAMAASGVDVTKLLANGINHPNREMHTLFSDSLFDLLLTLSQK